MTIILNIHTWTINQSGKQDQWSYDSLKIRESSGKRLYLTAIKDGIRMTTVIKTMNFQDGKIYISFGKVKHEIGTYEEVAA
jgi:hypothetical protein